MSDKILEELAKEFNKAKTLEARLSVEQDAIGYIETKYGSQMMKVMKYEEYENYKKDKKY